MKDLSPAARSLLERVRHEGAPDAATQARVEHALHAKLAGSLGAGAAAGAGKAAFTASSVTLKALVLGGVSGVLIVAGIELAAPPQAPEAATPARSSERVIANPARATEVDSPGEGTAPPASAPAEAAPAREAGPGPATEAALPGPAEPHRALNPGQRAQPASEAARSLRSTAPAREPRRTAEFERSVSAGSTPSPSPLEVPWSSEADTVQPPKPSEPSDPLTRETQGLREIQRALRGGDGQRALELIAADAARFSKGVLHQERAAARIQALCLVGRAATARSEAADFESRWPRSPLLAKVRSTCRP